MKIGEPIPLDKLPKKRGDGSAKYAGLYKQALSLNGAALPVECNGLREALTLISSCKGVGKGAALGLAAHRRGNTVYVYKR